MAFVKVFSVQIKYTNSPWMSNTVDKATSQPAAGCSGIQGRRGRWEGSHSISQVTLSVESRILVSLLCVCDGNTMQDQEQYMTHALSHHLTVDKKKKKDIGVCFHKNTYSLYILPHPGVRRKVSHTGWMTSKHKKNDFPLNELHSGLTLDLSVYEW